VPPVAARSQAAKAVMLRIIGGPGRLEGEW